MGDVVVSRGQLQWGKDDVVKLTPSFSQPNVMGEMVKGGYGAGFRWSLSGRARWRGDRARGDDSDRSGDSGEGCVRWTREHGSDFAANTALKPVRRTRLHGVLFRSTRATFTSRCESGRAYCRKKAGICRSRRARPTTSVGAVGDTWPMSRRRRCWHGAQAEGVGHQVGDTRRSLVRRVWRLESAGGHFPGDSIKKMTDDFTSKAC